MKSGKPGDTSGGQGGKRDGRQRREAGGLFVGNEVTVEINVEAIVPKPGAGPN